MWDEIDHPNLKENIEPTKDRARLILEKGPRSLHPECAPAEDLKSPTDLRVWPSAASDCALFNHEQ
jgi:hypothetical protein